MTITAIKKVYLYMLLYSLLLLNNIQRQLTIGKFAQCGPKVMKNNYEQNDSVRSFKSDQKNDEERPAIRGHYFIRHAYLFGHF